MFRRRSKQPTPQEAPLIETIHHGELDAEARLDERLIRNAQAGDLPSFNTLVTRHERTVYNVCLRMLRDPMTAEDAAQDTFIKAWAAIDSFRGGLVRPWLLRIATNRCYDVLRSQKRRPADSLDAELIESEPDWTSQAESVENPEAFASRRELSGFLERALAELPDDQRLVIILSDVQGNSYEQISTITGVPVGTVKSRISRARTRLRELIIAQPEAREQLEQVQRYFREKPKEPVT